MEKAVAPHRPSASPEVDPSTLSNYRDFSFGITRLAFNVDFDKKAVSGTVLYTLQNLTHVTTATLDTSFLLVSAARVNGASAKFAFGEKSKFLGTPLTVELDGSTSVELQIDFETTSQCTALQFLEKEATDGKTSPYLFSQCQAIHARSLFPCFDTPSVKTEYDFEATSPLPTLMSGRPKSVEGNVYRFYQPIPIPSYLVALASGDITKLPIGPRSHVYSEPSKVKACQHEFEEDMEHFLQAAEKLVYKYPWDQYDALVLPLSFPYGGMENPNATFVTPTLISGDRQNVDVIAHELAHSWSGNLVTNCSWEHFWLNEGWTVYLERRIQGSIHGESFRHFGAIIGWSDLENSIRAMGDSATRYSTLVQNQKDRGDPDDAFSTVPYEKGFNLLFHIEKTVGIKAFDGFINHYFTKFKFKSLDTYQFLDTLYEYFPDQKAKLDEIDWHTWLYEPGMPPVNPGFDTSMVDQCYELANKWFTAAKTGAGFHSQFKALDIESFTANQSVVFLETLDSFNKRDDFKWKDHPAAVRALGDIYPAYSDSSNAEVLFRWFVVQVGGHNIEYYDKLGEWLGSVGRMKFVRPGYVLLRGVDRELAIRYFKKFELTYHPICQAMVRKDLGLA
ncbi:leukotriene A-4 hydrol [Metschnikowia bicuspidata var. bicuspidata NRRL YB-4993]|uniref:Leukotriene A(4) hydrolase n=1 Tax=Metschnikowia bicuspidata var. bicuspidata NRRL YB-4993 TaxID=869754 RepID=A0A1A0HBU5_9ASCO|nr:leukotriene A-4 hydrol [Metschnikowia bicuspidata var. bicuspidata NRRL YB-4993]OBA21609.1 leukotriene A-4 hydrol [Metschnikowia bicuspidata var. bicuspidata NRRL YB-4993]